MAPLCRADGWGLVSGHGRAFAAPGGAFPLPLPSEGGPLLAFDDRWGPPSLLWGCQASLFGGVWSAEAQKAAPTSPAPPTPTLFPTPGGLRSQTPTSGCPTPALPLLWMMGPQEPSEDARLSQAADRKQGVTGHCTPPEQGTAWSYDFLLKRVPTGPACR